METIILFICDKQVSIRKTQWAKEYWTDEHLCKVTEESPAVLRLQSEILGKKQAL